MEVKVAVLNAISQNYNKIILQVQINSPIVIIAGQSYLLFWSDESIYFLKKISWLQNFMIIIYVRLFLYLLKSLYRLKLKTYS